ncbi:Inositol monophosphatase family protein [compost metagenome]
MFWRLLPWDHAAGVLFLEEAGGLARYLDGAPYDPTSTRTGLLAARNEASWHEIHAGLIAGVSV